MHFLTLQNNTPFPAVYIVMKGEQMIARTASVAPGAELQVPSTEVYTVVASTMVEGNTYTSAPITFSGATGFIAQILQHASTGTYTFEIQQVPARASDRLEFQKTTIDPVTFIISHEGIPLQSVVVSNSFAMVTLSLDGTYSIHAVINGVTTGTIQTEDPGAVITANEDSSALEQGGYTLVIG